MTEKVTIMEGDITKLDVDAIVNAAHAIYQETFSALFG